MSKSEALFHQAQSVLVGGVNSPVRAFKAVKSTPVIMKSAQGAYLTDEDNIRYIDYVLAFGPHLLGHSDKDIVAALHKAVDSGVSFGATSRKEIELAELIRYFFPSIEKIRLVNSGTEACMSAVRLARGVTKRNIIIKFNGCYHGHSDSLLVSAGSGALTFAQPDSAGIPDELIKHTIVLEYNDVEAVRRIFQEKGRDIAGIIIEPVAGNMGLILPDPHFLELLRKLCDEYDSILIFDEVMSGFRVALGGAQALYHVRPDITCLGKVIGGGLPCGAFGGRADIMEALSPLGPVYQAGTLSGNPLVTSAGIATLEKLKTGTYFDIAEILTGHLVKGMMHILDKKQLHYTIHTVGTMFCLFFTGGVVRSLKDAKTADTEKFAIFFRDMLAQQIYLAPSQFETNFLSAAHTEEDIEKTLLAFERAIL